MTNARRFAVVLLLLSLASIACAALTPAVGTPQPDVTEMPAQSGSLATTTTAADSATSVATALATSPATSPATSSSAATATITPFPITARPTAGAPLQLEIVQSRAWTDNLDNVRVVVLMHNPYDFPVAPGSGAYASVLNSAGTRLRERSLYFLDGISGGGGYLRPGETVAASACFTCEAAPLDDEWASVEFLAFAQAAANNWTISTEVEPTVTDVAIEAGSPLFWITGSVRNTGDAAQDRIAMRVVVFDQDGKLVGAAEASAWDVGPGAVGSISGYGVGEPHDGPVEYEVTALGVTY